MKKKSKKKKATDELRPEYDFSKLGIGVRGKYVALRTAIHETNRSRPAHNESE